VFEANSIITPAHVVTSLNVRTAPGPKDISQAKALGIKIGKMHYQIIKDYTGLIILKTINKMLLLGSIIKIIKLTKHQYYLN